MRPIAFIVLVLGGLVAYEAWKGLRSAQPTAAAGASTSPPPTSPPSSLSPGVGQASGSNRTLSFAEWSQILQSVGFSGAGLQRALGVSCRESGWQTHPADNVNAGPGNCTPSLDRGIFQFNNICPPAGVTNTDTCVYDPICAAEQAFAATNGGQNWSAWATAPGGVAPTNYGVCLGQ